MKAGKFAWAALLLLLAPVVYAQKPTRGGSAAEIGTDRTLFQWFEAFGPAAASARPITPSPQPVKTVSVNDLLVPPKALKELQLSDKARKSGDIRTSNVHLEKAVHIYPDFFVAHFDLGTNHLHLREFDQALTEYQRAMAIDPNLALGHHGVSVGLFFLHRYAEAEPAARQALEIDPDSIEYRYMLARTIVAQGHLTREAVDLLHQTAQKYPSASLVLAQVEFDVGKIDDAAEELAVYLKAPEPQNKANAECWLAILNGVATGACAANKILPEFQ